MSSLISSLATGVLVTVPHPLRERARAVSAIGDALGGNSSNGPAAAFWRHLKSNPTLGGYFSIHQGIEWTSAPGDTWSNEARAGCARGLHAASRARQFMLPDPVYVDRRQERPRRVANLPWDRIKLVATAARPTPGPWSIAAGLDREGLVCSGQFFGLWPKRRVADAQLLAFVAILNGPVASAFLAAHSLAKRVRVADVKRIPVPSALPPHAANLTADYVRRLHERKMTSSDDGLDELLTLIDAAVLGAYDLPARLEQRLLDCFRGSVRPTAHAWRHWDEWNPTPGLTLAERVSGRYRPHGNWILDVFQPLPEEEAELLRLYGV